MKTTVILPIHKIDEKISSMLEKAIASYEEAKTEETTLMLVVGKEVDEYSYADGQTFHDKYSNAGYTVLVSEKTDFPSMINTAASHCETEYFSILEYDDIYTKNVFKNADKYMRSGYEASVYIPLTEVVDYQSNEAFGYINEAVLASAFSDELNFLDFKCMEDFPEMNYTGAIFKLSDFVEVGKLKESMKLHFWHEYVLRALNLGKKMFVVPKVGYKHTVNRDDSFFGEIRNNMSVAECEWWFDLAKKEYFFKKDRQKTYEE